MDVLSTLEEVMRRHKGQYAVTAAVRDDRGIAYHFSVIGTYDNMDDAVVKSDEPCQKGIDSVVIPCLTDKELETSLSPTETAYLFRRIFSRHNDVKNTDITVSFDEAIAIFCEIVLNT